jgi:release factor glutamine methyltransferase
VGTETAGKTEVYGLLSRAAVRLGGALESGLDAEVLLAAALGVDRTWVLAHPEHLPTAVSTRSFLRMVEERAAGCPVAYLAGRKEFAGIDLAMRRGVFIPRPETEGLVELVREYLVSHPSPGAIVDAYCGSGAIGIALAVTVGIPVIAIDKSAEAVRLTRGNALKHRVTDLVTVRQGPDLEPLSGFKPPLRIRAVVANPPYIPTRAIAGLPRDVRLYEPKSALDGGKDGLDVIKRLAETADERLDPGGLLAVEIGMEQEKAVKGMLARGPWNGIRIGRDLAGLPRYVLAEKRR